MVELSVAQAAASTQPPGAARPVAATAKDRAELRGLSSVCQRRGGCNRTTPRPRTKSGRQAASGVSKTNYISRETRVERMSSVLSRVSAILTLMTARANAGNSIKGTRGDPSTQIEDNYVRSMSSMPAKCVIDSRAAKGCMRAVR